MLDRYEVVPGVYDEAFTASGDVRPHYRGLLEALADEGFDALADGLKRHLRSQGVSFRASPDGLLALDAVPRLLTAGEWETVRHGVLQRARALDRFAADVYGARAIVSAGVVPEDVIDGSEHYEPAMVGAEALTAWVSVVGFDLVRSPDGQFRVLEDQIRMPSGIAYAIAAREALAEVLPVPVPPVGGPAGALRSLAGALRGAKRTDEPEPYSVLLSDGPQTAGWYEHRRIAAELDIPLVTVSDIERRGTFLHLRTDRSGRPIDVVYLRTDEDRFTDANGQPTEIGELLLEPCRTGCLACVNAPGAGIGDDKLVHAYVDAMIRFYFAESPVLESVKTLDLTTDAGRDAARSEPDRLVFKPRAKMGGEGVVVWLQASEEERRDLRRILESPPEDLIAQERVELSCHPTVCSGRLEPRRVDLRPYVLRSGSEETVLEGGLSRVALERGSMIVNSGRGGGVKDTWIAER